VSAGAAKTLKYKDGTEAYLSYIYGRPHNFGTPAPPRPEAHAPRAADADLDRVYRRLLADPELHLHDHHRHHLHLRGLSDDDLRRAGYRSLPAACRAGILRRLRDHLPDHLLLATPGVIRSDGRPGAYLTLAGRAGLLVPVRSAAGHIVGLVVRPDDPGDGGKYKWLSSKHYGGPSPSARVHVPAGIQSCERAVIVEGGLKSDVVYALSGRPVIGLPGCQVTYEAIATLKTLGVREALLALDADAAVNAHVARAQVEGLRILNGAGFDGCLIRWEKFLGKGLDDALLAMRRRVV
jgi:hypothetical protein